MLVKFPIYKRYIEKTLQRSKASLYFSAIYPTRAISQSLINVIIPKPPVYYWNYLLKRDNNFNMSQYSFNSKSILKIAKEFYEISEDEPQVINTYTNESDNVNNDINENNNVSTNVNPSNFSLNNLIDIFKKYWYLFTLGFIGLIYILFKRK